MGSVTNFSVANSVKRGVVVFLGAAAMGTPVGLLPTVGAAVAVLGTAAYWVSLSLTLIGVSCPVFDLIGWRVAFFLLGCGGEWWLLAVT